VSANDGELDEVLVMLKAIATQPVAGSNLTLVQQQLQLIQARMVAGARTFTLMSPGSGNGYGKAPLLTADLVELKQGLPLPASWIGDGSFKKVYTDPRQKIPEPFPALLLTGAPGPYQQGDVGALELPGYMSLIYNISAVVFVDGDQEYYTQRKSVIWAEAIVRALRVDSSLGGLVQVIRPAAGAASIEPGGGGKYGNTPLVMASRVKLEAYVTIPY
jgi:hypothetical protein